jgi:hypothetical protein
MNSFESTGSLPAELRGLFEVSSVLWKFRVAPVGWNGDAREGLPLVGLILNQFPNRYDPNRPSEYQRVRKAFDAVQDAADLGGGQFSFQVISSAASASGKGVRG